MFVPIYSESDKEKKKKSQRSLPYFFDSKFKLKCNNINDPLRERTVVASKFVAPSRSAYEVIDISKKKPWKCYVTTVTVIAYCILLRENTRDDLLSFMQKFGFLRDVYHLHLNLNSIKYYIYLHFPLTLYFFRSKSI